MTTIDKILSDKKTTSEIACKVFDELEAVDSDFMLGNWQGMELFTSHPMDGLLASSGWYGKSFKSLEKVHPLMFYTDKEKSATFAVNPTIAMGPDMGKYGSDLFMGNIRDKVETKDFKARLRMTEYRGVVSATMIYDELPINDVFKKVDDDTVLGAMDLKLIPQPYFFVLRRD